MHSAQWFKCDNWPGWQPVIECHWWALGSHWGTKCSHNASHAFTLYYSASVLCSQHLPVAQKVASVMRVNNSAWIAEHCRLLFLLSCLKRSAENEVNERSPNIPLFVVFKWKAFFSSFGCFRSWWSLVRLGKEHVSLTGSFGQFAYIGNHCQWLLQNFFVYVFLMRVYIMSSNKYLYRWVCHAAVFITTFAMSSG